MHILVSGMSGFVGSALAADLRARQHSVQQVCRNGPLPGIADALVHLANIAQTGATQRALHEVNVEGTRRMAKMAARLGIRRFVYLSSLKAEQPDDKYGRS